MERYLAEGLNRGLRRFRLDVWTGNESAIKFYRSFGFEPVGESNSAAAEISYTSMLLER
jgi:ribosomal protein S18 acetylase RimI-like enzyme